MHGAHPGGVLSLLVMEASFEFGVGHQAYSLRHAKTLREFICAVVATFSNGFEVPDSVSMDLEDFSNDLFKFTLTMPSGPSLGVDPYEVYEHFSFVLGKGFYDTKTASGNEHMVWYVSKNQAGMLRWAHRRFTRPMD